jgi:hypothetical protein
MKVNWPRPWMGATVFIAVMVSSLFWVGLAKKYPGVSREHGPMENVQAVCLLIGVVMFAARARVVRDSGLRLTLLGVSLFYLTMLLLEFDVRPFKVPILTLLLNGPVRNAAMGLLWLLLFVALFKRRAKVLPAVRCWITSSSGLLFMGSGVFWVAGRAAEELHLFTSQQNIFAEELMENSAAIIMLFAAIEALRLRLPSLNSIDQPKAMPEEKTC